MGVLGAAQLGSLIFTLVALAAAGLSPAAAWVPLILLLSFAHFASALLLFYRDKAAWRSRPVLAWGLPILFLAVSLIGASYFTRQWGYVLVAYFPLLFWHYSKQTLGLFVIGLRDQTGMSDPNSLIRQAILAVFLLCGTFGYFSSQTGTAMPMTFGAYIPSLRLEIGPWIEWMRIVCVVGIFFLGLLALKAKRPLPFLAAVAFYLWMDFLLTKFVLLPFLPALHALQYIPLAWQRWNRRAVAWIFGLAILGGAGILFGAFRLSPRPLLAISLLISSVELVLNLHHYFLDAYIWRAREEANRAEMGL